MPSPALRYRGKERSQSDRKAEQPPAAKGPSGPGSEDFARRRRAEHQEGITVLAA